MTAIPDPWKRLMERAGIDSIRELANKAGLDNHSAINRVIMKGTTTSAENMEKVATALRVSIADLYEITQGAPSAPLTMPRGTELLSERQKRAIAEIIRTMVEEKENATGIVDKKSAGSAEQAQEKMAGVTPLRGRRNLTPAQRRFEESGRRVAKIKREMPEDSPKIPPTSSDTDK